MDPIAFRKIIVTGMRFDAPDGAPLLDAEGLPLSPLKHPVVMQVVFWVPKPAPYQRCSGATIVRDAKPFELQALRDGVIEEQVFEFTFPKQPSVESLKNQFQPIWDKATAESLALSSPLLNTPKDNDPKATVNFAGSTS